MDFILDIHLHTIASGHAYSTLMEYVNEAPNRGIELLGFSDHGPAMPGGPHLFHIGNQRILPRIINGVKILRGVEANVIDFDGGIDIPEGHLDELDYVIASLHDVCLTPKNELENTKAIINAMKNPKIDVIGHPGNPRFPILCKEFVEAAAEYDKIIEINNSSFEGKSREGSDVRCEKIAEYAKEYKVKVISGSDSHFFLSLGNFVYSKKLIDRVGIEEKYIMNLSVEKLVKHLNKKGRNIEF